MIKIIYVDSDEQFGKKFLDFLIEKNYDVKYTKTLKDAFEQHSFFEPHLIITEASLSDGNGISFLKKIIKSDSDVKTILLTDNATQELLMDAISLKVDKVLFKNKSFDELNNEIKALDITIDEEDDFKDTLLYDLGSDYYYDQSSYRIIYHHDIIQLTTQENLLIKKLLKEKGEFVAFEVLQQYIGKSEMATIETLRTVVKKIRKKTYNGIIKNKSGFGYKIEFINDINVQGKFTIDKNIDLDTYVLILKGDKTKCDLLKYNVEKLGIKCENTYTIEDAKTLLSYEGFDYLVIDLNLPDGDGVDIIRDLKDIKSTKIIVLSNSTDIHYKEYLYYKGIIDYIVDINDLNYLAYNIFKTIVKIQTNTTYNNILVVEKSKRTCEQLKDILLPRNYKVSVLNKLDSAADLIKTAQFSLVIIDLEFEDCYEFITEVKANIDKAIPFIVLSDTHRSYETVRDSYKYGASECLRKPIFAEEFILKVDLLIENSKLIGGIKEQKEFLKNYQDIVDKTTIVSKSDIHGNIIYANEMFCKISGYSLEELIGKPHSIVRSPDTPKEVFKDMWKTIKEEKNIWQGVLTNRSKDGSSYTVDSSIMPLLDQEGQVIEFIALRKEIKEK